MNSEKSEQAKILIVDNDPIILSLLSDFLKESGFIPLISENGNEGLLYAEFDRPDLILLDVMMPGMDGFETCRRLKENEHTKDIPVIFLTGLSNSTNKIRGFESGAADYIPKPFQLEEVSARITAHLTIQHQKKELSQLNARLSELNAAKDKFFSIIAHDLKSPFNGLINLTSFVVESFEDLDRKTIKEYMELIHNSSKETFTLLENLLEWSRSQTGRIIWNPRKTDIKDVVNKNLALFRQMADEKNIFLTNEIKKNIFVYADENMIATVIRNLVTNALKYTNSCGKVSVRYQDAGDFVEILVSDTGVGIEKEHIDKLFRIDIHYSTRGTAKEHGSGLGLILCKEFVEKNRGKIRVESEPGKGTTFGFTLMKLPLD
ncbi:hybrid sensor histidine kinase/response regulator [Desulfonema magnum]|uniref:histidine kinase n=1 Tax=Desulfonema magnum TaxID=45655 RepID=A0A975BHI8_9BACT|nr:hybrid sensor histidine kinase/response regulator [Desulfonema magnum]QTA85150.1 Two component system response regulator/histidine kinase [Desulfonema magnum]